MPVSLPQKIECSTHTIPNGNVTASTPCTGLSNALWAGCDGKRIQPQKHEVITSTAFPIRAHVERIPLSTIETLRPRYDGVSRLHDSPHHRLTGTNFIRSSMPVRIAQRWLGLYWSWNGYHLRKPDPVVRCPRHIPPRMRPGIDHA